MKRRGIIRVQLALLGVLAVLVIVRMAAGPPKPSGVVVFTDMHHHSLEHDAFELEQAAEVAVKATGSFMAEGSTQLATYGWIVRREDRKMVWKMEPGMAEQGRRTAATVRDTFELDAGIYDVYFSSYGDERDSSNRWRNDQDQWQFVLRVTDESVYARTLERQYLDHVAKDASDLVWTSAPVRNNSQEEFLFEVNKPTPVKIYAVGEIASEQLDYGWLEDAATGERVWEMNRNNTNHAGGLERNRSFDGVALLKPGAYRAAFVSNRRHAHYDWSGHPPYDPAGWGLTLRAAEGVSEFDPWTSRTPLISMTRVRDDAEHQQRFEVFEPVKVVAYGVGEMMRDEAYDYAILEKEEATRKERIWEMSYDASAHAGGGDKNRLEVAFLRLEPGVYTLRYKSDGSHSYEYWNVEEPDYPERWGVTLFPVAPSLNESSFQLLSVEGNAVSGTVSTRSETIMDGEALVSWTRVGNDANERHEFELGEETTLHIVAQGEITDSGQHDYGWIERTDTGETVWEMGSDNTFHAGGVNRNRRFDNVLTLPAGSYVARYRTDFSHAYSDFNGGGPSEPEAWGMRIHFVDEVAEGEEEN